MRVTQIGKHSASSKTWFALDCAIPAPRRHHVEVLVRERAAGFARVLALVAVLWIPLDAWMLGAPAAARTAAVRVLLGLALAALAQWQRSVSGFGALWLLIGLQVAGFGLLEALVPLDEGPATIGYGLFPFVIAAELALFPLPWCRSLALAALPAALFGILHGASGNTLDAEAINRLWLFGLLVLIAAWAGHAQLRMLLKLWEAQSDAMHDPLTGLANRRHAAERLDAARAEAVRHGTPLAVLMLDIDRFKRVNDRHGHAGGDRVLVAVARALTAELRGNDLASRHGGEEFLAVLPGADLAAAHASAERIRAAVAALRVELDDATVAITISIGYACLGDGESADALIARADAALYRAKQNGRDRCEAG